jgi:Flp pilus assembly protein CpaB
MSKTRIVILGLAIGSAILAAYLAKGFIGKKPRTEVVTVISPHWVIRLEC